MAKPLASSKHLDKRIGHDNENGPLASACGVCGKSGGHEGLHQSPGTGEGYGCGGNDKPDVRGLWTPKYKKRK